MKDSMDIVGWILAFLGAVALANWRMDKKSDNEKFKVLFNAQRESDKKMGIVETKIDNIERHHLQTLEDIKSQQMKMAEDVTSIKIAISHLPKRKEDD